MKKEITDILNGMVDKDYAVFQKKLIFTDYQIIGVRSPDIKKLAKTITLSDEFFLDINFNSYEEFMLYCMVLGRLKDPNLVIKYVNKIIPFFDNWAHVDCTVSALKIIAKIKNCF